MRRTPAVSGMTPGGRQPRFPDFDALAQVRHWDPVTAGVVLARVGPPPPIRFFTPAQEAIARPLLDLLLDQQGEPKVPVLEMIDSRLAENSTDGWRYADLPEDGEAWQQSLAALDADAHRDHDTGFARCDRTAQSSLVGAVQKFGARRWHDPPAAHVWSLWTRYACTADHHGLDPVREGL
jgi:Gluconate 2-dehydrogenase subunit 3